MNIKQIRISTKFTERYKSEQTRVGFAQKLLLERLDRNFFF